MSRMNIINILTEMLKDKFNMQVSKMDYDEHLFSNKIGIQPRTLVYMFYFIQQEFNINIDNKYILDGSFSTINNITDIIFKTLQTNDIKSVK